MSVTICPNCGARSDMPSANLHCAWDLEPHAWHTCGDMKTWAIDSDCPLSRDLEY